MQNIAALVIGIHKDLPAGTDQLTPWFEKERHFRKTS